MTSPAGVPQPGKWLTAYAKVQSVADREILAVLRVATRDIQRTIRAMEALPPGRIGEVVRLEQFRRVRAAMLREQARVFERLGNVVSARRLEAAARASTLGSEIDRLAFAAAGNVAQGDLLAEALQRGLRNTVETAVTRMTQSQFSLSERIYKTNVWMDGRVQTKINSALARGLTAKEFAKEAEDWFSPDTPGGVRYAALRLARTEINNAFHAISVSQAAEKPWVQAMQWHLSGSHPKADECDSLAHEDRFNIGAGKFPPREVPRKPHPHCFCYVTPSVIEEDAFLDQLTSGGFDDYLNRKRAAKGMPALEPLRGSPGRMPGLPGNESPTPALSKRAAARARLNAVQAADPIAATAARIDQALGLKTGDQTAAQYRQILDQADLADGPGLPADVRARLEQHLDDPVALRKAAEAVAREAGLTPTAGRAGTRVEFDGEGSMETLPGVNWPEDGEQVFVYLRGYSLNYQGEEIQMFRTVVFKK